jgi:hypothetical protein
MSNIIKCMYQKRQKEVETLTVCDVREVWILSTGFPPNPANSCHPHQVLTSSTIANHNLPT